MDVYLASHLLLLMDTPFPDPLLQTLVNESYPTLCGHARRIHLSASPATGSYILILPEESYSLGSLIPSWPSLKSAKNTTPKNEKLKPDDVQFERMKWGWIALASLSALVYIAKSGIVQAVVAASRQEEFTAEEAREIVLELNAEED